MLSKNRFIFDDLEVKFFVKINISKDERGKEKKIISNAEDDKIMIFLSE